MKDNYPAFPYKRMILFIIGTLYLFFIIFFLSCKKIDTTERSKQNNEISEQFFSLSDTTDKQLFPVIANLKIQLSQNDEVVNFIRWHGQPLWDKAIKVKNKDSSLIFYIPTLKQDDNKIATFFAAQCNQGKFSYEMHRRSSIKNNLTEFSTTGLTEYKNERLLALFDRNILGKKKIADKNPFATDFGKDNAQNQGAQKAVPSQGNYFSKIKDIHTTSSFIYEVCTTEEIWWDPDGAADPCDCSGNEIYLYDIVNCITYGGDDPDPGGDEPPTNPPPTGGGGGGDDPPTGPGGGNTGCIWYNVVPCGGEPGPLPPDEPTPPNNDSLIKAMLRKEMLELKNHRDSVWNTAYSNDEEWHFFIKVEGGISKPKKDTTEHDPDGVTPDRAFSNSGNPDGDYHTHQDHPGSDYRHPQDPQDIAVSNGRFRKLYYRAYVDCGDTLYVVVNENLQLIKKFFRKKVIDLQLFSPWSDLRHAGSNRRTLGIQSLKALLGNSKQSGLGFYKSINSDKTEFTKIN